MEVNILKKKQFKEEMRTLQPSAKRRLVSQQWKLQEFEFVDELRLRPRHVPRF